MVDFSGSSLGGSLAASAGGGGITAGLSASTFGSLGGAVGDIFGAVGSLKAASAYTKASQIELQNAAIARASTQIQLTQTQRHIFQTIGAQKAAVGAAGFANSGSAQDLLRSSLSQGALQRQVIQEQGLINVNSYEAQATAYQGQAAAAKASAGGGILGGILKFASAALPFLSDADAKINVTHAGPSPVAGINYYLFQYKGDPTLKVYRGVLAQEVQAVRPDAVQDTGGYLMVNYPKLGLRMEEVASA